MSLKDQLDREFARLTPFPSHGDVLAVSTNAGRLECELCSLDSVGCAFDSFVLSTEKLADASLQQLKSISDSLAARLSYLLEPIALVEADEESCVVQMRSNPPQQEPCGSSYYELVVRRGGQLRLCRYAKSPGSARQLVPAQVTREVLLRIAKDFEEAVS